MAPATAAFCSSVSLRHTLFSIQQHHAPPAFRPLRITMAKRKPKNRPPSPSPSTPPANQPPPPDAQTTQQMLLKDLETFRAKRKQQAPPDLSQSVASTLKNAVDMFLLADFFLVIALLVWLGVALVPHFVSKNDVLLDPWLQLWQPFIQPVLGVLMLGTVVQGTLSYMLSKD